MTNKIIRVLIVSIIVYYIFGFLLYPLRNFLESLQNQSLIFYAIVSLAIFAIELTLVLFLSGKFMTLKTGDAKKIAIMLSSLTIIISIASLVYTRILINTYINVANQGGGPIQTAMLAQPNLYLQCITIALESALIYFLAKWILSKTELPAPTATESSLNTPQS